MCCWRSCRPFTTSSAIRNTGPARCSERWSPRVTSAEKRAVVSTGTDPEWSRRMNGKAFLLSLALLLMSSLFIWDGIVQLRNPGGTAQYFASVHIPVPSIAVWISILVHLLGGLALLAGF